MSAAAQPALPPSLSVLVVDDHPLIRQGVRSLLAAAVQNLVFVEAATAAQAREQLQHHSPDLIIVDMVLPDLAGLELIRELRAGGVATPILALSMHGARSYAARALRAGASGYVMKEEVGSVLLEAMGRVLDGEIHLSPEIARSIAARVTSAAPTGHAPTDVLTERELQIWHHLGNGRSTRRIASLLEISPKTVETHCYNIRGKLGIGDMTEMVHAATRWLHGLPDSS